MKLKKRSSTTLDTGIRYNVDFLSHPMATSKGDAEWEDSTKGMDLCQITAKSAKLKDEKGCI